jgi:hypothetical protein
MPPSAPPPEAKPANRKPPPFRPRFTIGIFYLVAFFFLFSFLQILPDLIGLLEMPPGPDQEAAAAEAARLHSSPLVASLLALLATSIGSYYRVLPGMKID